MVTNTKQLRASINHIYGYSLDSKKYLDKFIKYTISLPDAYKNGRSEKCKTSVTYWLQLAKDSPSLSLIEKHIGEGVRQLISQTNLSLRETHTYARNFNISLSLEEKIFTENTYYIYRLIYITAVFIHCFGEKDLLSGKLTTDSIDKLATILGIDTIPYSFERTSDISRITIIFYEIIRDSLHINKRFSPQTESDQKQFDDIYKRFEDADFWNCTVKDRVNDFTQEMSFIK